MFKKGFTLIELVLSIAIIGILSVSIFSIFNLGIINIARAGDRTISVEKATDNIRSVENTEAFEVDVLLPNTINPISVAGTRITGKSIISGTVDDEVKITTYVPIK